LESPALPVVKNPNPMPQGAAFGSTESRPTEAENGPLTRGELEPGFVFLLREDEMGAEFVAAFRNTEFFSPNS
jgi:hypothetical protein